MAEKLGFGVVRLFLPFCSRHRFISHSQVMVIGSVVQMTGYVLNSIAPPFPVFIFAYFLGGFGIAIQDAGASGYVSCLNSSTRMGVLQSLYGAWEAFQCAHAVSVTDFKGLGAFCAPLVSTQFAQLPRWSFHYLVSLGLSLINTVLLVSVFRLRRQDGKRLARLAESVCSYYSRLSRRDWTELSPSSIFDDARSKV